MLMWLAIAVLILAGVALLIVEVIFIPGTTLVGLLGLIFIIGGLIFSYSEYGSTVGNYVLLGTSILSLGALYLSFRKGAWKKFSLRTSIDSKVNEGITAELTVGLEGITVSVLRPMGTAEFLGKIFEVKTNGDYLAAGTRVKIVQLQANDILVEPST
jgi:membrane-bound ClpP family serine protease